ncbi:hypothetical protein A3I18_01455 [Candidatus Campbellbacteria bacterium RIFCSPLOWO2_02_FULL_35_11]|uniref:DUF11 domain-containing protein n=1 Tax=Candidatus Campbellbacteria bacterium RIFCSPLOWO2_02_FULL_35_11 TaxID=1797581 RepID=A0A1F5ETS1_9BACT|nr:MAG: hypothetical protein A3I18_01455 [Candidatus Campbellbacteria bacterium RIFCSPLOWO2_02_FULL_35_11]
MINDNNKNDLNRLERLKKGLYSKTAIVSKKFSELHPKKYDIGSNWNDESISQITSERPNLSNDMPKKIKKEKNWIEKFLVLSIVLFVIATVAVLLTILGGVNKMSTSNVDISVIGPVSIESGGELSIQLTIENNNSSDLELADLIVEYPKGTRSVDGIEMEKFKESLGTIKSGKEVKKEVKAILFGEENSDQEVIISLEYRMKDSNAIFFKEKIYDLKISSSPINLIISPIEESISGQEVNFSVSVISNSKTPLDNLLLVADYPFGFEFKSSDPKPDYSDNSWKVSGDKQVINIKGVITGQEGDERVFKFTCGTPDEDNEKKISAIFALAEKSLGIKNPFLGIDLAINGTNSSGYILSPNQPVRVDITWKNNSPAKILDGEITVKLRGEIIDKGSVSVDKGFYRSSDNAIVWEKRTNNDLAQIDLGDTGRLSFYFETLPIGKRTNFTNPEITIDISAKGNRVFEGEPEEISSTVTRTIKVSSDLAVTPRGTYYSGVFTNTGPLPPQVEKETTYTITWSVTNSMNDVDGVRVISSLPPYVRWMGVVSPSSEKISYNPVGGEIIWNVGDVKSGVGIKTAPREVSFQVALLPSITQANTVPNLTSEVKISGTDSFTNQILQSTEREVTTMINTDPGFTATKAVVAE